MNNNDFDYFLIILTRFLKSSTYYDKIKIN